MNAQLQQLLVQQKQLLDVMQRMLNNGAPKPVGTWQALHTLLPYGINAAFWIVLAVLAVFVVIKAADWWATPHYDISPKVGENPVAVAIFWGLILAAIIFGIFGLGRSANASPITSRYDSYFQTAAKRTWGPQLDWRYAKAQAMTESAMNRFAKSPVGACGLMQFMPATAREWDIDCYDPRASIKAGVAYMRQLTNIFSPRPTRQFLDRYGLAAASYNWGAGNVIRIGQACARKQAGDDSTWLEVQPCLPAETAAYWPRIERWQARFAH